MQLSCAGANGKFCSPKILQLLVRSTPDRVVRVRALARDIDLCFGARHFTLMVPLSTYSCINGMGPVEQG